MTVTGAAGKMIVDLTLSAQSIILLIPMIAVFSFLVVFVAPWIYSKVSHGFLGGARPDPRGPAGAMHWPSSRGTHQTRYRDDSPGNGGYGSSCRGNYQSSARGDDYAHSQYFYQGWEPPQPDFVADDSDSDDDNDDDNDNDNDSD